MEKKQIAVLGAGFMGKTHVASLLNIEEAEICGVCDSNMGAASMLAQQANAPAYNSYAALLQARKKAPDALVVCLPPFAHGGEVEQACQDNTAVFLEKPIALTLERARSIRDAVRSSGVVSQVGYHQRFGGAVRRWREWIEGGKAGEPVLFTGQYEANALHAPWWRDRQKAGGQVLEQVIHTYDMALYMMGAGEKIAAFAANLGHRDVEGYTIEDVSSASIRFASGALGGICATNCAVPGEWNNPFTVVYEKATAHFASPNDAVLVDTTAPNGKREEIHADTNPYYEEMRAFVNTLLGRQKNICTVEEGYESYLLVAAALQSAGQDGQAVDIKAWGESKNA